MLWVISPDHQGQFDDIATSPTRSSETVDEMDEDSPPATPPFHRIPRASYLTPSRRESASAAGAAGTEEPEDVDLALHGPASPTSPTQHYHHGTFQPSMTLVKRIDPSAAG